MYTSDPRTHPVANHSQSWLVVPRQDKRERARRKTQSKHATGNWLSFDAKMLCLGRSAYRIGQRVTRVVNTHFPFPFFFVQAYKFSAYARK